MIQMIRRLVFCSIYKLVSNVGQSNQGKHFLSPKRIDLVEIISRHWNVIDLKLTRGMFIFKHEIRGICYWKA